MRDEAEAPGSFRPATNLHVLQTVGSLVASGGGPTRSVPGLCESLAAISRVTVSLMCCRPIENETNQFPASTDCHQIDRCHTATAIERMSQIHQKSPIDLLHDHGMWLSTNRAAAKFARQNGIQRVVTPRGMLSPWALNHHRFRKWAAWQWFGKRDVQSAAMLHATSDMEAEELRHLGLRNPIGIIPNGIELGENDRRFADRNHGPTAVFMSRIHQKKGIDLLLDVWESASPDPWELLIAGPDPQSLMRSRHLPSRCQYIGPVEGVEKAKLLQQADLFILPSYSENFGIVIAEALAASLPVITTTATPWAAMAADGCGWCVNPDVASIRRAIRTATGMERSQLQLMGRRGRQFVSEGYQWSVIGEKMEQCYRWLQGLGDRPEHVHVC